MNNLFKSSTQTLESPLLIDNLFMWLDATDSSTVRLDSITNNVSAWIDKSGHGRNFEQTNVDNQPEFLTAGTSVGGKPAIHLHAESNYDDAYAKFMHNVKSSDFNSIQTPFTCIAVLKIINDYNLTLLSMSSNATLRRKLSIGAYTDETPSSYMICQQGPGDQYSTLTQFSSLTNGTFFTWSPQAVDKIIVKKNNEKHINNFSNFIFEGTTASGLFLGVAGGFELFGGYNAEATRDTEVTEILLFDRVLKNGELNKIQDYFNKKYNISSNTNSKLITKVETYNPPTNDIVAFYNFDDTNWHDSSDNNYNLNFYGENNVTNVSGVVGNAANFDGTGRLYTTDFGVNVNGNFTVSGWFNTTIDFSNYQHILGAPFENGFFVSGNGVNGLSMGLINTGDSGAPYMIDTGILELNTWYHLACVRNGNKLTLYVNGQIKNSVIISDGYTFLAGSVFSVGGGEFNEYFYTGLIDAVGVWNTALKNLDIYYLYNNGAGRQLPFTPLTSTGSKIISR